MRVSENHDQLIKTKFENKARKEEIRERQKKKEKKKPSKKEAGRVVSCGFIMWTPTGTRTLLLLVICTSGDTA